MRLSNASRNRIRNPFSEETKKKMSESAKKKPPVSIETKRKLSELRSKKIIQKTLDDELIKIWDSAKEIQRELGFSQGNISRCCNGEYGKSNGYKWEYYKQ
jgi:hypothetical protein